VFRAAGDDGQLVTALRIRARSEVDQGHYKEADLQYQEALATYRRMGKDAPAVDVFETKRQYAGLLNLLMRTRPDEVRALYDELVDTGTRDQSIPRVEFAAALADRSGLLAEAGKHQEAEAAALEALAIGRKEEPGGPWEWEPLFILTNLYSSQLKYQAAKEVAQRLVYVTVRNNGPDSLIAAQARNIWAAYAVQTGETAAAADATRESMRVIEKSVPPASLNLWHAARNASNVMRLAGQYAEAEHYARESVSVAQAAHLAADDARTGNAWEALGRALLEEKKYPEAIAALEQAEAVYRRGGKPWPAMADRMHKMIESARGK